MVEEVGEMVEEMGEMVEEVGEMVEELDGSGVLTGIYYKF
jgi:methyl-accepting chemotaxis protein